MLRKFTLLVTISLAYACLTAQNPVPAYGEVFRPDVVPRIDIFIDQDSLDMLIDPANAESNYHYNITLFFDNGNIRDTLENVGLRLRGNTSRYAAKKSIKLSFNTYESGRQYHGLEKLNINGEHNDPSISRSRLCWDILRWMEIPAPRANHVQIYINNEYIGVFANIEHIDEEFVESRFGNKSGNLYKCLWPATLQYISDNPDDYKNVGGDRRAYDLKTNTEADDYSDLAHFIDILNNTPTANLPCELEKVFNVNDYLKAIAFDILSSNWDGPIYNKNNFYLYHNQATGKFEYIPYDLDNTFGIDWFVNNLHNRNIYDWAHPSEPRPIYDKIMAVEIYRHRFSYYMNQILENVFNETVLFPYLDDVKNQVLPLVEEDFLYPLDYGFDETVFENSFEEAWGNHVRYGLKPYIEQRRNSALQQLQLENIYPIASTPQHNQPTNGENLVITTKIEDDGAIANVLLCYQFNYEGNLTCINMQDDGQHEDGEANDGVFGITISDLPDNGIFNYSITPEDTEGLFLQTPFCDYYEIYLGSSVLPLYINELMASNDQTIADEAGEYDDWIELYHAGTEAIWLGDKYLTDDLNTPGKWKCPDIWMQPNEFLLFWADNDEEQGELHTNFKLSAGGETIALYVATENGFAQIDRVTFGDQITDIAYGRLPNGTGEFQVVEATPGASNILTSAFGVSDSSPKISISPNPFSKNLTIVLEKATTVELELVISNMAGQEVYRDTLGKVAGSSLQWEANTLPSGTYVLYFYENGGLVETRKVIFQGKD